MRSKLTGFVLASSAIVGLLCGNPAQAQLEKRETSPDKIKVTVKAGELTSSGMQKLAIRVEPAKNWYIYANPVGNKLFKNNATKVTIKGKSIKKVLKIEYPKGKLKKDDVVGNYNIYPKAITINAVVQRTGDAPFEVGVTVQSCNKAGICLIPGTKTVNVK